MVVRMSYKGCAQMSKRLNERNEHLKEKVIGLQYPSDGSVFIESTIGTLRMFDSDVFFQYMRVAR